MHFYDSFEDEGKDYNSHFDFLEEFSDCFKSYFQEDSERMRFIYDEFLFKLVIVARAAYCAVIEELK